LIALRNNNFITLQKLVPVVNFHDFSFRMSADPGGQGVFESQDGSWARKSSAHQGVVQTFVIQLLFLGCMVKAWEMAILIVSLNV